MPRQKNSILLVLTTLEKKRDARRLARILVEEKLAACVSMLAPIESFYRWQDKLQNSQEWMLIIKTSSALFSKLKKRIETIHPYECPEIVGISADRTNTSYHQWLLAQVAEN